MSTTTGTTRVPTTGRSPFPTSASPQPDGERVAERLLRAIVERDGAALLTRFAPDVWLRVMLVREVIEHHDAVSAVARFQGWFGSAAACEVLHAATYPVASRQHLTYRFRLRPSWAPDVWHDIEQTGYLRVRDGRVSRLDLVCTGFHPET
jgi:hypothetical protein